MPPWVRTRSVFRTDLERLHDQLRPRHAHRHSGAADDHGRRPDQRLRVDTAGFDGQLRGVRQWRNPGQSGHAADPLHRSYRDLWRGHLRNHGRRGGRRKLYDQLRPRHAHHHSGAADDHRRRPRCGHVEPPGHDGAAGPVTRHNFRAAPTDIRPAGRRLGQRKCRSNRPVGRSGVSAVSDSPAGPAASVTITTTMVASAGSSATEVPPSTAAATPSSAARRTARRATR